MPAPKSSFAASLVLHATAAGLLFSLVSARIHEQPVPRKHPATLIDPQSYRPATEAPARDGGGGVGDRSPLPASRGRLPKPSPHPFTPPMLRARDAAIVIEPALLNAPEMPPDILNLTQWGDPLSKARIPSNGPGSGGGMGSGENGGVGPRSGPRAGRGDGDGDGAVYQAGQRGVTAPEVIYQIDPEFSEEARRAKHHGSVILLVDVDPAGRVVHVRVVKALGLGLDEKAVEAVSRWKFRPGRKDGMPVTVPATIEVNFHLL